MRKWFGIEGLGLLCSKKLDLTDIDIKTQSQFSQIRKKAFIEKKKYFEEALVTKNYLHIFNQAELYADSFSDVNLPTKDSLDRFYNFDFVSMKEKRKRNYLYLQNNLACKQVEIIKYLTNETPLFFSCLR